MLSNSEQGLLRKLANHALIDTCDIYRKVRTSDGAGGNTFTETLALSGVSCRITSVRNDFEQEMIVAGRVGAEVSWILSLPYGTDVRLTDIIRKGSSRFEVMAVLGPPRSISTVVRVVIGEVK